MKKIAIIMILIVFTMMGCTNSDQSDTVDEVDIQESVQTELGATETEVQAAQSGDDELNQTLSDWVLGTEYGIEEALFDYDEFCVEIKISEADYAKLQDYDFTDIRNSIIDILYVHGLNDEFEIIFANGEKIAVEETQSSEVGYEETDESQQSEDTQMPTQEGETVNLIFIHHSVGENWLNAGLNQMLNYNNFHVSDTYYGWREMGDRTDTSDWPNWFNDDVMPTVYNELGNMTGYNDIDPAPGENTIIMFKSCFPNSDVGSSISDEKEIYNSLLGYFSEHPDKMFILVTPPPMQSISHPDKTRELANWLVDENGWRKGYDMGNLFVFDFYNVLTAEDNYHMLIDCEEKHIINDSSNTLHYDSAGDDHPSDEGSIKATQEFVPLLMYWYEIFSESN